jgi:hypothetical protein
MQKNLNQGLVLIEMGPDSHVRWLRGPFLLMLYRYIQQDVVSTRKRSSTLLGSISSVVLLFGGTHKCVTKHISQSILAYRFLRSSWCENDCLIHVFVLITTPLGLHSGSCLVVHSGNPLHLVTHLIHEYHVDTPWISMPLRGFHSTTQVAIKWA